MNKFLEALDNYKYGIIAALLTYFGIFIYTNLASYKETFVIEGWYDEKAELIEDEQIEIKPENIEVQPENQSGEVKNMVKDQNDTRQKSDKDYSESEAFSKDPEKAIKELEEQYRKEAGGDKQRADIQKETEDKKKKIEEQNKTKAKTSTTNQTGGDKAYSGNTMVSFSLANRTAFENNKWHIRNPGYTCGQGASGSVTMTVKVDVGGRVTDATVKSANTTNACILEQAKKYALISRFNPSSSAPKTQEGTITYTFISQ
jgi:outer membrane biosynthesis protein TonB